MWALRKADEQLGKPTGVALLNMEAKEAQFLFVEIKQTGARIGHVTQPYRSAGFAWSTPKAAY